MTKGEIIKGLGDLEPWELNEVAERARELAQAKAKLAFSVGDKVRFAARGRIHEGEIVDVGPKNIKVQVGPMTWRVSPTLLRAS